MSEYWVSQAKKYCEFCKCWISDNKPSVNFHENGKKHKENVGKRLSEISKKSAQDAKKAVNIDKEMKKMEEAAMKAYLKDMQSNPDYTSKQLLEQASEALKPAPPPVEPVTKLWREAKADNGDIYYWNIETGESKWEAPAEGFIKLTDKQQNSKQGKNKFKKQGKNPSTSTVATMNKKIYSKPQVKKEIKQEPVRFGPLPKGNPYGSWVPVVKPKHEPVDLQLPEQEYIEIKVPVISNEPPLERTFREKKAAAGSVVSAGGETSFKKRKFGGSAGRNARQRLDD